MVTVDAARAPHKIANGSAMPAYSFDAMFELADHEASEKDEALGSRDEAEGLVRDDAGLRREMR